MAKAIFTTKLSPSYDDIRELQYHFPKTYLRQVEAAVGDEIIYYEPRRGSADLSSRGGASSYFATARVVGVSPDPKLPDHFYAHIEDYLDFNAAVPFREDGESYELALTKTDGSTNKGAFGRSVRLISDAEFEAITSAGFVEDPWDTAISVGLSDAPFPPGFSDPPAPFIRPMVQQVLNRPFRDRAFRRAVRQAYDNRCAVTGLRLINGGGRPEVQAAHIQSVEANGPDSVRNGLALSGTIHWLFDRGKISIGEDMSILRASAGIPDEISRLIQPRLLLPKSQVDWPHPHFISHHRTTVFQE